MWQKMTRDELKELLLLVEWEVQRLERGFGRLPPEPVHSKLENYKAARRWLIGLMNRLNESEHPSGLS